VQVLERALVPAPDFAKGEIIDMGEEWGGEGGLE
jgi:hypothetical protein